MGKELDGLSRTIIGGVGALRTFVTSGSTGMPSVSEKWTTNHAIPRSRLMTRFGTALAVVLGLMTSTASMAASPGSSSSPGELTARWWQWAFSFPADVNPVTDDTGERCTFGQNGDVWFLAGSFTTNTVDRDCGPIPAGRHILIPVLNAECSSVEGDGNTRAALRQCATGLVQGATGAAKVDGLPVRVIRAESPLFLFALPEGDVLDRGPAVSQAVAAGLWALIPPLPAGPHTIEVQGKVNGFTQNIRYDVTVVAP